MLIIVSGLPGTGKTSLALALSARLSAEHFNTDMIRDEMQKRGQYDKETKKVIYEELCRRVQGALENGKTVVIDATFYQEEFRLVFLKLAETQKVALHWIELEAAPAVIRQRVSKKRAYSEADFAVYQKIKKAYEPLTIPHLVLPSGRKEVEELAEEALAYIMAV